MLSDLGFATDPYVGRTRSEVRFTYLIHLNSSLSIAVDIRCNDGLPYTGSLRFGNQVLSVSLTGHMFLSITPP